MKKVSLFAIILAAVLSACGDRASSSSNTNNNSGPSFGVYDVAGEQTTQNRPAAVDTGGGGGGGSERLITTNNLIIKKPSLDQTVASQINTLPTDRKIIRNAELNLEAENPELAQQQITAIAEIKGGFVVESQQSSSDIKSTTRDIVVVTVRVPAERFSDALDEIRKTASRVVVETVKGQDVTEEFIDIEAQLKAKKALELQFMVIMKRANSVEDALNVQSQLADVRGEIERIEGRKRFLENQASLSTIKIRLQTAKVFAASSEGFGDRFADAFTTGFDVALNLMLGLLTLIIAVLPFALFIGLPGYLVFRYLWRRQTRPKSMSEIAEEELKNG